MLLTNETATFEQILTKELRHAVGADIAVGYCGLSAITSFSPALIDVAKRGRVRLVLGMYRVDGSISTGTPQDSPRIHAGEECGDPQGFEMPSLKWRS